jgi:hypothetical protein
VIIRIPRFLKGIAPATKKLDILLFLVFDLSIAKKITLVKVDF